MNYQYFHRKPTGRKIRKNGNQKTDQQKLNLPQSTSDHLVYNGFNPKKQKNGISTGQLLQSRKAATSPAEIPFNRFPLWVNNKTSDSLLQNPLDRFR